MPPGGIAKMEVTLFQESEDYFDEFFF